MLALARRPGESIHIGDNITVQIVSVRGQRVKLAIDAPREISIDRHEIWLRKFAGTVVLPIESTSVAPTHLKPR